MYGCTMNRNNPQGCTILLIIIILACQGLLDGSPRSRNAITLLLIWWLCNCGGCSNQGINQQAVMPVTTAYVAPTNNSCCCSNNCCCCYPTKCCSTCCCKPKEKKCKCKRVKVCYNNCGNAGTAGTGSGNCGCCCC